VPAELGRVPLFADLDADAVAWIAAQAELLELEPGAVLFHPGERAEWMFVNLEGTLQAQRDRLGPGAPAFVFRAGEVAGTIPFSRMTTFAGTGRAVTRARVARFPKSRFPELLHRFPDLVPRFVALLADRVRDATRRDAQFEKLTALGRLSAGLAHELTNPAAGAARGAQAALDRLDRRSATVGALLDAGISPAVVARLDAVRATVKGSAAAPSDPAAPSDALARSDREEAIAAWLGAAGVAEAWEPASTFADAGLDPAVLDDAVAGVPPHARAAALAWLESVVADQLLLAAVRHATERVAQLVDAVKGYTHMDRARALIDVEVRAGVESALALLERRAEDGRIAVVREYAPDLPPVPGYPGDLNQAWGALLENALDAAATRPPGTGRVTVRIAADAGGVVVEIVDNGPGVPPELEERIWEPFFTTKDVGRGTGLGLDIARRVVVDEHGGRLTVASVPGDTRFTAWLPRTTVGTFGA